jgi:DNA-binding Lrp family transcriptional regulator
MKELDDKDRNILSILSRDAKIPLKTLAGEIGLSRSATSERVLFLEKSGVIRGYRADIGQLNEGLICAFLLISLVRTPSLGFWTGWQPTRKSDASRRSAANSI